MKPDFSVVITAHQQPAQLLKCLDALGRQSIARHQFEIIVVDDGDSPAMAAAVALFTRQLNRQHGTLDIRYLPQPISRGAAAARNRGWQAARGRLVAFTNDECLPQPTWLANALSCFDDTTEFVIGQLWIQPPYLADPVSPDTLHIDPVSLLSANCFCRKPTLERVGGFPETVYSRQADVLLLANLTRQAIAIKKSNKVSVVHHMSDPRAMARQFQPQPYGYNAVSDGQQAQQPGEHVSISKQSLPIHCAAISGALTGLTGLLTGGFLLTIVGFGVWLMLSALFGRREQPQARQQAAFIQQVGVQLATPFVSVYWQLYSTLKQGATE